MAVETLPLTVIARTLALVLSTSSHWPAVGPAARPVTDDSKDREQTPPALPVLPVDEPASVDTEPEYAAEKRKQTHVSKRKLAPVTGVLTAHAC